MGSSPTAGIFPGGFCFAEISSFLIRIIWLIRWPMEAFFDFIDGNGIPRTAPLGREMVTVGSSAGDAVLLPAPAVPRHASVRSIPNRGLWELARMHPSAPLSVNRRPVAEAPVPLNHHDVISFAGQEVRFIKQPAVPKHQGRDMPELMLKAASIMIGRDSKANEPMPGVERWDLDGEDSGLSRQHVRVDRDADQWFLEDLSRSGTELNGVSFARQALVIGDRFRIRDYFFEFTGESLRWVDQASGATISGRDLRFEVDTPAGSLAIMEKVSVQVRSGEFLGILGGSGQGKSTLLNLLSGLAVPTSGKVEIDGRPPGRSEGGIGFVPLDDIVHRALTVRGALTFAARLRILAPDSLLEALVSGTVNRLGLKAHIDKRVGSLSGGQRKRVNIATELLARPAVLFLDEPSSGLDPATEEELMTLLQNLRLTGQTVVCTTHVLHKAYLFDRVAFIHGGRLMFLGTAADARTHFLDRGGDGSETATRGATQAPLERIYALFGHTTSDTIMWESRFAGSELAPFRSHEAPPPRRVAAGRSSQQRPSVIRHLSVLMARQWSILRSDPRNLAWLLAQSVIIGLLGGWVGRADPEFRYFTCLIATFWFGCSNAAQQITQELAVFRRERVCGVGLHSYILSKAVFLTAITVLQSVLLIFSQMLPALGGAGDAGSLMPGEKLLTLLAFALSGAVGVMLGLTISSHARNNTQAAMLVPLILIPQILFSGFVVPLPDMPAAARVFSSVVPSGAAQRMLDAAWIWERPLPAMVDESRVPMFWLSDERGSVIQPEGKQTRQIDEFNTAWQNLAVNFDRIGDHAPAKKTSSEATTYRPDVHWGDDKILRRSGDKFEEHAARRPGPITLGIWIAICYVAVWFGMVLAQPEAYAPAWARRIRARRARKQAAKQQTI